MKAMLWLYNLKTNTPDRVDYPPKTASACCSCTGKVPISFGTSNNGYVLLDYLVTDLGSDVTTVAAFWR